MLLFSSSVAGTLNWKQNLGAFWTQAAILKGAILPNNPDPPIRSQELFCGSWFLLWKCISGRAEGNGFCWFLGVIRWDGRLTANSLLPILHRGSCILASGFVIGLFLIILLGKWHKVSFGKLSMLGYFLSLLSLIMYAHFLAYLLGSCCSIRGLCFTEMATSVLQLIPFFNTFSILYCLLFQLLTFSSKRFLFLFSFCDQSETMATVRANVNVSMISFCFLFLLNTWLPRYCGSYKSAEV